MNELSESLQKENISISTIGIGSQFNDAVLASLAKSSNGSYRFNEDATLIGDEFIYEFSDLFSTVATKISVQVDFAKITKNIKFEQNSVRI